MQTVSLIGSVYDAGQSTGSSERPLLFAQARVNRIYMYEIIL